MVISVNYGFLGCIMTVTIAKSSAESEEFTMKIRSESGKLFTIGVSSTQIDKFWYQHCLKIWDEYFFRRKKCHATSRLHNLTFGKPLATNCFV